MGGFVLLFAIASENKTWFWKKRGSSTGDLTNIDLLGEGGRRNVMGHRKQLEGPVSHLFPAITTLTQNLNDRNSEV